MRPDISNKKIELFADNRIDKYRTTDSITLKEMINIFFRNQGFFVLEDENHKIRGYLDMADISIIKELLDIFEKNMSLYTQTINIYLKKNKIEFRTETINSEDTVINVIHKLEESKQNYFPVIKEGILIGRISKRIIKEKIDDLYTP